MTYRKTHCLETPILDVYAESLHTRVTSSKSYLTGRNAARNNNNDKDGKDGKEDKDDIENNDKD